MKKFFKNEQGYASVILILAMMTLLSVLSLVIDLGRVYFVKSHMQKAVNSAALSAAQSLPDFKSEAYQVAQDVMALNHEEDGQIQIQVQKDQVTVQSQRPVALSLAGLVGFDDVMVDVEAKAVLRPMTRVMGAAPVGINESWYNTLQKYHVYALKVDHPDIGYTGILRLGTSGKQTYYENLRWGYDGYLEVNDIVHTETGTVTGKTRSAVKERMYECPTPPNYYNSYDRDCSRILLVPTYLPEKSSGSIKEVRITGFAYFFVEGVESNGKAIIGRFIQYAGTGYGSDLQTDYGAYAIRLSR